MNCITDFDFIQNVSIKFMNQSCCRVCKWRVLIRIILNS